MLTSLIYYTTVWNMAHKIELVHTYAENSKKKKKKKKVR